MCCYYKLLGVPIFCWILVWHQLFCNCFSKSLLYSIFHLLWTAQDTCFGINLDVSMNMVIISGFLFQDKSLHAQLKLNYSYNLRKWWSSFPKTSLVCWYRLQMPLICYNSPPKKRNKGYLTNNVIHMFPCIPSHLFFSFIIFSACCSKF